MYSNRGLQELSKYGNSLNLGRWRPWRGQKTKGNWNYLKTLGKVCSGGIRNPSEKYTKHMRRARPETYFWYTFRMGFRISPEQMFSRVFRYFKSSLHFGPLQGRQPYKLKPHLLWPSKLEHKLFSNENLGVKRFFCVSLSLSFFFFFFVPTKVNNK